MRERLTTVGLATLDRALRFGDLVILPREIEIKTQTETGARLVKEPWVRRHFASRPDRLKMPWPALQELRQTYERHREGTRREPRWVRHLPSEAKRHFRYSHYFGDGFDPLAIVPNIPFTGVGYMVADDGLAADVVDTFKLFRLHGIRQLAFLHDPLSEGIAQTFGHTRYNHVHDVSALARLIAIRNGLSPWAQRALQVATLTHDVLTPAGGDTTKIVDRAAFDEDANYLEAFTRFEAEPFLRRHRLSKAGLFEIIQNHGVLGKILDLADKIAYVGRDALNFAMSLHFVRKEGKPASPAHRRLQRFLQNQPTICGLWDSVTVADGQVFVEDGARLAIFLELRAHLFRDLYYNPQARFLEHTIASVIIRDLYETGVLTRDRLLTMEDWELERMFAEVTGVSFLNRMLFIDDDHAAVETFTTKAAAERREDELERTGEYMVLNEEFVGATGTGAKMLVRRDGRIQPFSEAYPAETKRLQSIMRNDQPYRLYYFPIERSMTPWFRGAMARYRARRTAERQTTIE